VTTADQHAAIAEIVPIKGMRAAIAKSMMSSLQGSAQLTLHRQFDAGPLVDARRQFQAPDRPSLNDLILAITARVLRQHPEVNATVDDQNRAILRWREVNIGMAVALDAGLVVPVIRNADKLTIAQLRAESLRLAGAARQGQLSLAEMQGGTFTVTNLGSFGIDAFTPIINPPQVAILGIGRIHQATCTLSLTIDHRALDGVPGAQFLADLATALEAPSVVGRDRPTVRK
jgi:pyruvate dehydrogenase E2 component (dihydrolipoamide acetyltransferase)